MAGRNRHSELGEQFLGLIFVNVHGLEQSFIRFGGVLSTDSRR
jgi:hypothetical protein